MTDFSGFSDGMITLSATTVATPLSESLWADYLAANTTQWPGDRAHEPNSQSWIYLDGLLTLYIGLKQVRNIRDPLKNGKITGEKSEKKGHYFPLIVFFSEIRPIFFFAIF